jgi:hypothetical protein
MNKTTIFNVKYKKKVVYDHEITLQKATKELYIFGLFFLKPMGENMEENGSITDEDMTRSFLVRVPDLVGDFR